MRHAPRARDLSFARYVIWCFRFSCRTASRNVFSSMLIVARGWSFVHDTVQCVHVGPDDFPWTPKTKSEHRGGLPSAHLHVLFFEKRGAKRTFHRFSRFSVTERPVMLTWRTFGGLVKSLRKTHLTCRQHWFRKSFSIVPTQMIT